MHEIDDQEDIGSDEEEVNMNVDRYCQWSWWPRPDHTWISE